MPGAPLESLKLPRYLLSSPAIRQDRRGRWPEDPGTIDAPSHHDPGDEGPLRFRQHRPRDLVGADDAGDARHFGRV